MVKQLYQVVELAMYVSAYSDGASNAGDIWLLTKNFPGLSSVIECKAYLPA